MPEGSQEPKNRTKFQAKTEKPHKNGRKPRTVRMFGTVKLHQNFGKTETPHKKSPRTAKPQTSDTPFYEHLLYVYLCTRIFHWSKTPLPLSHILDNPIFIYFIYFIYYYYFIRILALKFTMDVHLSVGILDDFIYYLIGKKIVGLENSRSNF